MIFVTVGLHTQPFDRLVQMMDTIARDIEEPVVMQVGPGRHIPVNATYFTFLDEQHFTDILTASRVVVGHAGAGTILKALSLERPLVVVPRERGRGEAVDDHQHELARKLSDVGLLRWAKSQADLERFLREHPEKPIQLQTGDLVARLRQYLDSINARR